MRRSVDHWTLAGMRAVRFVMKLMQAVSAATGIACALLPGSLAARDISDGFVVAQTSLGGSGTSSSKPQASPSAPAAPPLNLPEKPSAPKFDYIPPSLTPDRPSESGQDAQWGAIGFTADGSYSSVWQVASKAEAEAQVAKKCASYGHGGCEVVSFSGQECAALATFIGNYRGRRWSLSFTAGGNTYPEAQNAAMSRCNSDERSQGRCQPRTAACADGR
jgi:hypothetical protein